MNLATICLSSFIIALSGALVPGPLFTITVSEAAKRGASAGPLIIFGHGILEILLIILLISGLSPFLKHEITRQVISFAGGSMLIVMGLVMIRNLREARIDLSDKGKKGEANLVLTGIIGSLSNPYWVIWWATIGLGYLVSSMKYGTVGIVFFFLGHISADLAWYSIISFAVAKGKKVMGEKGYRRLLFSCACFLIFFGGWFVGGM